jgi:uncharacterized membrane protein HdeD (DUF308 family)
MLNVFTSNWWTLALRGLAAVIFGVLAFFMPIATWTALVFLFGAYALVNGIFAIIAGIRAPKEFKRWWALLIVGIFSVIAGVLAFIMPGVTSLALLIMIASWAMATGIFEIVAAIQMRKYITGEWLMVLSGILSIVFAVLLLINPFAGMLAIVWIVGVYALIFGILMLILGFKLRSLEHSTQHPATPHPA